MAYFHVLLTLNDAPHKARCVLADLTEADLRKRFVKPYQRGANLFCSNEVVDVASIRSITIVKTERSSEEELQAIQVKSREEVEDFNRQSSSVVLISAGRGWSQEDIAEAGAVVTATYITGRPGHGGALRRLQALVNHPWVASIGTGLIVAALVWWLGWT